MPDADNMMKKRFCRMLAVLICTAMLALCAGTAAAEEKHAEFLGKPFPDFTVTDTEGNTLTLSGLLEGHDAVLINIWATWCPPCQREFPFLNEAYEKYGDRVAFVALSMEDGDTIEKIAEYRTKNGISFPMGRDEGGELYQHYTYADGVPATVIVDRFGNAAFYHDGTFRSAEDVERVLETFLGDGYQQSAVLERIPRDASTRAFPVSAARALYPDGGTYRKILFHTENLDHPIACWIVPDESVPMRIEIAADDDIAMMMCEESYSQKSMRVTDLLNPEAGAYTYEQAMPVQDGDLPFVRIELFNDDTFESEGADIVYLIKDESGIESVAENLKSDGFGEVSWEYADADAPAENTLQAYTIHVVDQDNHPVEDVMVNFCTDRACIPKESDENGTITFTGEKGVYHVQIVDAPDGYSWDEEYEMYTPAEYSEWILRVRKD